mgnify:FL=1
MAIGDRIFIYEAEGGELVQSLRAHDPGKNVYVVAYSKDGKFFASGGADRNVIIWNSKAEGVLKYNHNTSVQALAFNPVTHELASVSVGDFTIWEQEQKKVEKIQLESKGLAASWSPDGLILAIGLFSGKVLLKDKQGKSLSEFSKSSPVWCLEWNPVKTEDSSCRLAVGCWDETLSFWDGQGKQIGVEKELGFDPCCMNFFGNGEFLVIGGSDKKVTLWTKDGVKLGVIGEGKDWFWSCKVRPKHNCVAVGSNEGTISMYQLSFNIVHGLYKERYAHRELMTDVIIQHLVSEQKVRIKCRDLVKKISVYKDRLAVQLPERVVIYAVVPEDELDMKYKSFKKINKAFDCTLLVMAYKHVLICYESKIQLYNLSGELDREWHMEAVIRYIKVMGGPPGRELVLVGLKNGNVLKLFVDNPFPVSLYKHTVPIRCLDLSASKNQLAIVDDNQNILVYDIKKAKVTFQDNGAGAVAWNSEMEDLLAYSGNGSLSIKTGQFPAISQNMLGFVVGFRGSKIYSLNYITMNTVDVPQSAPMYKYLENKEFENAYEIACLGVTDQDWRNFAIECIQAEKFELARKAFMKLQDIRFLELISKIEHERKTPGYNENIKMGEIAAYQGKYDEAAALYAKGGNVRRAVDMFKVLKQWEKAQKYVKQLDKEGQQKLLLEQAADAEQSDWQVSAKLFLSVGEFKKAVQIIGSHNDLNWLIEVCRQLSKAENSEAIQICANLFRNRGHHAYAKEAYLKLGDIKSLLKLHVELGKWEEAFRLAKQNPELKPQLYLPYAQWLISNDKFEQARDAFKKADQIEVGFKLLNRLIDNSIDKRQYGEASRYYWQLCLEHLSLIKDCLNPSQEDAYHFTVFEDYRKTSEIYVAYSLIHKYAESPFLMPSPNYEETIFNSARFLLNNMTYTTYKGINKLYVYWSLGRIAARLGSYKTAKTAYEKLEALKVPYEWQEEVDLAALTVRAKPYQDKEELFTVCYRCMNSNSPLNSAGDQCMACKHPFIRSFLSFTSLPLVEFEPAEGISSAKAAQLLRSETGAKTTKRRQESGWEDTLNVEAYQQEDIFVEKVMEWAELQMTQEEYHPVVLDEATLGAIPPQEVFILDLTKHCPSYPKRYFRLMIPDVDIAMCENCGHFFLQDEYDFAYLENEACPVCLFKAQTEQED